MTSDLMHGDTGLTYTSDILIITKSLKDVMVLNELGYEAVSPMAENVIISEELINSYKEKYKSIVIFYDNDGEFYPGKGKSGKGKQAALHAAKKYSLPMIFLGDGEEKDISDYVLKHGKDNAKIKMQ
jgi:DNA primase